MGATHTAASGGLSGSFVILILWLMSVWDLHMSTEQALAFVTVLTAFIGWIMSIVMRLLAARGIVVPPIAAPPVIAPAA